MKNIKTEEPLKNYKVKTVGLSDRSPLEGDEVKTVDLSGMSTLEGDKEQVKSELKETVAEKVKLNYQKNRNKIKNVNSKQTTN